MIGGGGEKLRRRRTFSCNSEWRAIRKFIVLPALAAVLTTATPSTLITGRRPDVRPHRSRLEKTILAFKTSAQ